MNDSAPDISNLGALPVDCISVEVGDFSLAQTIESGQCFRFEKLDENDYSLIALDTRLRLRQSGDKLFVQGCAEDDFARRFRGYFSLDDDYGEIKSLLAQDERLKTAISFAPGLRVLRQPLWETLCSFILSQNNNIKRIKGIIARLCRCFGDDLGGFYSFPSAERLAALEPEALGELRCGFRDKYVVDAARRFANEDISEHTLRAAPLGEARAQLTAIFGVGPKVADCVLLFGAARLDAFPRDVWVNRIMARLFPEGLPEFAKPYAGIAQQYLFHYARLSGEFQ